MLAKIEIEKVVIASIMYKNRVDILEKIKPLIYSPIHKKIVRAMIELETCDELILGTKLKEYRIKEYEILEIVATNPIENIDPYIEILSELKIKRELSNILSNVSNELEKNDSMETIIKLEEKLNKVKSLGAGDIDFEISNINEIEDIQIKYINKDFIPFPIGSMGMISGKGGVGKSSISIKIAIKFIIEQNRKTLLWLSEDPKSESKSRIKIMCDLLDINIEKIENKLHITNKTPFQIGKKNEKGEYVKSKEFIAFKEKCKEYGLIVLDPLISFLGVDENSNTEARIVMNFAQELIKDSDRTLIFLHHTNKSGETRGAITITDICRVAYLMDRVDDDKNARELSIVKDNLNVERIIKGNSVIVDLY